MATCSKKQSAPKPRCQSFITFYAITVYVALSLTASCVSGLALSAASKEDQQSYLRRFGYLRPQSTDSRLSSLVNADDLFQLAVRKFQRMAGLNQTGVVDSKTKTMMEMPRCGVADEDGSEMFGRRRKRYNLQGKKWPKTRLTYRINNFTPDLNQQTTTSEIKTAFKYWSDVTPLTFTEVTSRSAKVDIDISFARGDHGDGASAAFDGPGKTLAHAYFPLNDGRAALDGDAHFDEDETWSSRSTSGTNLLQVAIHEFGHSLGLEHSDVKEAIMAPFYGGYVPNFKLHNDDISGITRLYGSGKGSMVSGSTTTSRPSTRSSPMPGICNDPKPDAIFSVGYDIYVFKGSEYYTLNASGILPGYPRNISTDWPGLPNDIDTAVYWRPEGVSRYQIGFIYFFKGDKYWTYTTSRRALAGSPSSISSRFPRIPENLDAAFVWSGNDKLYFVKGDKYYRYSDSLGSKGVIARNLSLWEGLPSKIDAAFQYLNLRTYFFSGQQYYRFDDYAFKVDADYPRSTGKWWLGCPDRVVAMASSDASRDPRLLTQSPMASSDALQGPRLLSQSLLFLFVGILSLKTL